jgi:transcriptional regulator NrdR family protein
MEIPEDPPMEFYILENTGQSMRDHVRTTTMAVQSYAQSMERAADLAYEIDEVILETLQELDDVAGVRLNSLYNFTDQSTKQYRYQGVYVVTHY